MQHLHRRAGGWFQDNATKAFEDIMLIQDASDLAHFREMYDIIGDIKKIY